jgi:hypothetical protein
LRYKLGNRQGRKEAQKTQKKDLFHCYPWQCCFFDKLIATKDHQEHKEQSGAACPGPLRPSRSLREAQSDQLLFILFFGMPVFNREYSLQVN